MWRRFNLFKGETDEAPSKTPGTGIEPRGLARSSGGRGSSMSVYDLPPGEAIGPSHFEWTDEEWLIARRGTGDGAHR